MLDPSIITNGAINAQTQQANNMNMLGELGGAFGKLLLARQINDMNQMATPEEEKAFAQKHKLFAPQLMQQYNDNRQAEIKAFKDGLVFDANLNKTEAETDKLKSESGKIGAEKGKINAETTGLDIGNKEKRYGNIASVYSLMMHTGDINAGKSRLEALKANGLIDDATYQSELANINALPTDRQSLQNASFATYRSMLDPKYNVTTPDNELDNQTSTNNNVRDNQTRITTTGMNNDTQIKTTGMNNATQIQTTGMNNTGAMQRTEAQIKAQFQLDEVKAGRAKFEEHGGKTYFTFYKNGRLMAVPATDANGNPIAANGTGANGQKPLSEAQSNAYLFGTRMNAQNKILSDFESKGISGSLGQKWLGGGKLTNALSGSENQQYQASKDNWILAVLRKESGAAIGKEEYEKADRTYFPQVGDSPAVIKQKQQARLEAERGVMAAVPQGFQGNYPAASAPPAGIAAPSTQQSLAARDKYFTGK